MAEAEGDGATGGDAAARRQRQREAVWDAVRPELDATRWRVIGRRRRGAGRGAVAVPGVVPDAAPRGRDRRARRPGDRVMEVLGGVILVGIVAAAVAQHFGVTILPR